jgi:membrane protein required for colicin V production
VVLLVRLVAKLIEKSVEMVLMGWANKIGGILLYIVLYMFLLSVLLFFAQQVKLFSESTLQQSVTWPWIQPLGPWVINGFGKLVPVFKDMFTELSNFFAGLAPSNAS